jgi:hypothetical protein
VPDPLNYGWRDYAVRVGIWRMIEALDRFNMRASVLLNADCCERYPQIIEAGKKRNWCWLAHGKNNSIFESGMSVEDERKYLQGSSRQSARRPVTGSDRHSPRPAGRCPFLVELIELVHDDLVEVLAGQTLGDKHRDVVEFDRVRDRHHARHLQGERLVIGAQSRTHVRPSSFKRRGAQAGHDGVWLTTTDEIATHYEKNFMP